MKKPEILIGDFIRLNSLGLNKMTTEAPAIATAFAAVMKQLAIKYGNITIPGQPVTTTTSTIPQRKPLCELKNKKEYADAIVGDIISLRNTDGGFVVITKAKLIDAFNETFTVEITYKPLTRDLKNKNKEQTIVIENYYDYFITPYGKTVNDKVIWNKRTNLVNLICSMPIFKFKHPSDKSSNPHFFYKEYLVEIKDGTFTKSYEFRDYQSNTSHTISIQDIIKMFFNETLSNGTICETFLLPVLVNEYFLYEVKPTDILGIKLFRPSDYTDLEPNSDEDNFIVITELISNKPKNKIYSIIRYNNDGSQKNKYELTIIPDDATNLIRDFYKGVWKEQGYFVESPFENTRPSEFLKKFRTFTATEFDNICIFSIYKYITEVNNLFSTAIYNGRSNLEIVQTVFKDFEKPIFVKELLETNLVFDNYYANYGIGLQIYYLLTESNRFFYTDSKGVVFNFKITETYKTLFTVLPVFDLPSFQIPYNNPLIKWADIPIEQGSSMMYYDQNFTNKNRTDINYNEIFNLESVNLIARTLSFDFIPNGEVGKSKQIATYSFIDFVNKLLKTGRIKILDKYNNLKYFQGEEIDFRVNGKYLISQYSNVPAFESVIKSRRIESSSGTDGKLQIGLESGPPELSKNMKYDTLFELYNPFGLKVGDKVEIIDKLTFIDLEKKMKEANQDYAMIVKHPSSHSGFYVSVNQEKANNYDLYRVEIKNLKPYGLSATQTTQQSQTLPDFETIKIGDLEVYDADVEIMNWDDAMKFAENFSSNKGTGTGWRLPTVEEFNYPIWDFRKQLKNSSTIFWTSKIHVDNMYAVQYDIQSGTNLPNAKTALNGVLVVRDYNEPKTIETIKIDDLEVYDAALGIYDWDDAMEFAENFTAPDGIGTGWRLPTVGEFKEIFKVGKKNPLKNPISTVFWTSETPVDNMYAYAYDIELGEKDPWKRVQTKGVLLVRDYNKPKTITVNTLPGIEAINFDVPNVTYEQAKQTLKGLNSGLVSNYRFPTDNEMKAMSNEIRFDFDRYWVNEENTYYSVSERLGGKAILITAQYPVRFVRDIGVPFNSQTTNEIKVGDIVEFEPIGGVWSAEKGAKAIVNRIDNSTYELVWLDELSKTQNNGGYFKENFIKSKNQTLFKKGDFVKSYRSPTKKLEIIYLKAVVDGNYQYVVEDKKTGYRETFSEYELEPYEQTKQPKFKVGDIVIVKRIGTTKKYEVKSIIDNVDEDVYIVKGNTPHTLQYLESELELYEEPKQTQTPKISIIQNIETIPQELSIQYYLDINDGSRNSPTQKAGELKSKYKGTMYEDELLSTYFKGNDGLWYKINVEVGGVWKWRKADPQPQEPQTQNEPTLNTDYASMSQNELQQRVRDIKIAMEVFDEEDEEYKDLETELDLIKLYLEN